VYSAVIPVKLLCDPFQLIHDDTLLIAFYDSTLHLRLYHLMDLCLQRFTILQGCGCDFEIKLLENGQFKIYPLVPLSAFSNHYPKSMIPRFQSVL